MIGPGTFISGTIPRVTIAMDATARRLTITCDALFVWRRSLILEKDGQEGVCCTIFRNEGPILSSTLIQEADELAWARWPGLRHYTYVADGKIRSVNPGYSFKCAGYKFCGRNATGKLTILERLRTD